MTKCDICGGEAVYDAKLNAWYGGQWAFVCEECFRKHSVCAELKIAPRVGFATVLKKE
jgi:hypothetical protein